MAAGSRREISLSPRLGTRLGSAVFLCTSDVPVSSRRHWQGSTCEHCVDVAREAEGQVPQCGRDTVVAVASARTGGTSSGSRVKSAAPAAAESAISLAGCQCYSQLNINLNGMAHGTSKADLDHRFVVRL